MSTADLVFEKTRALPDELQREALQFVDTLIARKAAANEARNWSQFSATQLASQYASGDAVYDQD